MNTDFPRVITLLRKERKISQKKAAADLGVSQALLSHYEKGIRECGLDFLVRISEYYDVSCDYLLGRSPEPKGSILTSEMLPEPGSEKERLVSALGMNAALGKKLLINAINMLYSLLVRAKSERLFKNVSGYLMAAVYKSFRTVYAANPKNDSNMFSVDEDTYRPAASSAMDLFEAEAVAALNGEDIDRGAMLLNSSVLSEEYGAGASAMMNIVKNSESSVKKLLKAYS